MAKIKDIKLEQVQFEYFKPFHITGSISTSSTNIRVTLYTEEGIVGLGEASPSFRVNGEKVEALIAMESFLKESLKGLNTCEYRKVFDFTDKLIASPSLKAAIQFATIHAFCQEFGMTVDKFWGGLKSEIQTDMTVGIGPLEERLKDARAIYEKGFRHIKIKVGENLNEDIEAMKAIAEKTPGSTYIVDANMGYSPKEALSFVREIYRSGIDIAVFEQPVHYQDLDGLKFVRFHSPFPVAADESARTKFDVYRLIKSEVVDYVNIKLMKSGISDALAIVEMAKASGVRLMIGCMGESSLGISQSVLFSLGTGAFDFHDLDSHMMLYEEKPEFLFIQDGPFLRAK
ncbi:MAG: L-Ala-D/L-Glu epimerase [candidate division WOR-3 bacterium]